METDTPDHDAAAIAREAATVRFISTLDLPCPRCGYRLAGADSTTCPECGHALALKLDEPRCFWTPPAIATGMTLMLAVPWLIIGALLIIEALSGYNGIRSATEAVIATGVVIGIALNAYLVLSLTHDGTTLLRNTSLSQRTTTGAALLAAGLPIAVNAVFVTCIALAAAAVNPY